MIEAASRAIVAREGVLFVAATDNDPQGEGYAGRICAIIPMNEWHPTEPGRADYVRDSRSRHDFS